MDWQTAIDRQRNTLISIISLLMKSLGLVDGGALTTLPYFLYRRALLIIRPAEAAVRRLIMMVAYDMELRGFNLAPRGAMSAKPTERGPFDRLSRSNRSNQNQHHHAFNLIDPLKTFGSDAPDYSTFGASFDPNLDTSNRTPTPAASLGRRLLALKSVLENIDKQARRLTRWYAARDAALAQNRPHRLSPLRPGFPPGYRKKPQHEIEEVLLDCHSLAQYAREKRDSS